MTIKQHQIYTLKSGAIVKLNSRVSGTVADWNCTYQSSSQFGEQVSLTESFLRRQERGSEMTEEAKLWCVHVTGADDIHPMPSRAEALEEANALNTVICRSAHEEGDPVLWAIVTEWPYTSESHAASVAIRAEAPRTRAAAAIQAVKEAP